jgi:DHA1 family tetracycline resistance protein-like MFS transporter
MASSDTKAPDTIPQHQKHARTPIPRRIFFLMVISFLSTMGIGIVNPVLPFIVQPYVANPNDLATVVGWLSSVYAICQFLMAPGLGLLSDRFGRRPILLLCLIGSALGYLLFGLGGALWMLFLGRIVDGLTGANFGILAAYVADVTEPEERGKYFGLFGAVSGMGFIAGPMIGGLASTLSYQAPVYVAAALTIISIIWGFFGLPESLAKDLRIARVGLAGLNPLTQLRGAFAMPQLRWLLLTTLFFMLPFAVIQSNSTVLIKDSLNWGPESIGTVFLVVGVVDILMQGVLIGRLLPIFGEVRLTIGGLLFQAVCYILLGLLALVPSPLLLFGGIALFAVGSGLIEPALNGLISRAAGPRDQGVIQGGAQSMQALALVFGPLLGGVLYGQVGHAIPYWSGTGVMLLAVLAVILAIPAIRAHRAQSVPAVQE